MNDEEIKRALLVVFDGVLGFLLVVGFVDTFLPSRPLALPTGASSLGVVLLGVFGFACGTVLGTRPRLVEGCGSRRKARLVDALLVVGTLLVASLVVLPAFGFVLSVQAVVDGVPAFALWYASVWILLPSFGQPAPTGATWGEIFAVVVFLFFWSAVVRVPFEAYDGRSLGKRLAGIHVVDENGEAPSFGSVVVRNALRPVDSLPFGYVLGATYSTEDGQRIGDTVAGTRVVRQPGDSEGDQTLP